MEAAKLLLPALTALVGAWLGAQMALGRFKRERAFDRRLDWYERMARRLQQLNSISWEMATTLRKMEPTRYIELAAQAQTAAREFDNVVAERYIYAKRTASEAVGQGLLSSFRLQHDLPGQEAPAVGGFWERQHQLWTTTHQVVSAEIREELFPERSLLPRPFSFRRARGAPEQRNVAGAPGVAPPNPRTSA